MNFIVEEDEYGETCFTAKLDLNILTTLNYWPWLGEKKHRDPLPGFSVLIEKIDSAENPTQSQINTLEYIKSNQSLLIDSMFRYLKDVVYPILIDLIDIEPEDMIESTEDLKNILGLLEIRILRLDRNDFAYATYFFDFRLDIEHGLYFIFHKDRILNFCGQGDLDFRVISMDQLNLNVNDGSLLKVEIYDEKNNLITTKQRPFKDALNSDGLEGGTYKFVIHNGDYSIEEHLKKL